MLFAAHIFAALLHLAFQTDHTAAGTITVNYKVELIRELGSG